MEPGEPSSLPCQVNITSLSPSASRGGRDLEESRTTLALAVLQDALNRCRHEDMRTPEVGAALKFLEARSTRQWPFDKFRQALEREKQIGRDEEGTWQSINAALNAIKLAVARSPTQK